MKGILEELEGKENSTRPNLKKLERKAFVFKKSLTNQIIFVFLKIKSIICWHLFSVIN